MIKKLIQITCALTLLTGSAHISAVSKPVSLSLNLETRGWLPELDAILENPNTDVQQKLAEMIELKPFNIHGRQAAKNFGYALAELVINGVQLDQVVERDGTTLFHKLMASPNFTSGAADWFAIEAFASPNNKPSPYDKYKITKSFFDTLLSKPNAGGQTPLYFAAETNSHILEGFIKKYPAFAKTINIQTKGGKSPLFKAAEVGNKLSVQILLKNNADVTLRDQFGLTAYDTAVRNGHTEIANVISEYAKANGITNFANKYKK